jgi:uncharacterized protein DUF6644
VILVARACDAVCCLENENRVDPFFAWIEDSAFSTALRESDYAFPLSLTVHATSVALVAGTSLPLALRLVGYLKGVPITSLMRYLPIFWVGLVVSAASGLLLLIAYPTKSLTNPIFYLKIAAILAGIAVVWTVRRSVMARDTTTPELRYPRVLGGASIALWVFVIAAGRLLAYTYSRLMVGF